MLQRDLLATEIRTYAEETDRLTRWVETTVSLRSAEALIQQHFLSEQADTDTNLNLALGWRKDDSPATALKLVTARLAELAALSYFKYDKPVDVSRTQLLNDPEQTDWVTHDIFLQRGRVPVDVKSARRPNWLPARARDVLPYREFLVPDFKRERELGKNVRIAGVLSPHLDAADLGAHNMEPVEEWYPHRNFRPSRRHRAIPKVFTILGTTSLTEIRALEERFTTSDFAVEIVGPGRSSAMVPPWVFTHHPRVLNRLPDLLTEFVRACEAYPQDERALPVYPVPYYLAARHPVTPWIERYLGGWERQFYELLLTVDHSLPHLHLALLKHFVWAVRRDLPNFEPFWYETLLYGQDDHSVVGVPDPLRLTKGLIWTLRLAWNHRQQLDLARYESFHYRGMGILQGASGGVTRTILAYCRDCATSPLIAGLHDTCDTCLRLACPHCGACGYNCPDGHTRKTAVAHARDERLREREEQIRAQRGAPIEGNPF